MFYVSPKSLKTVVGTVCDREQFGDIVHDRLTNPIVPEHHSSLMKNIIEVVFAERETVVIDEDMWSHAMNCLYFFFETGKNAKVLLHIAIVHGATIEELSFVCEVVDDQEFLIGTKVFMIDRYNDHMSRLTEDIDPEAFPYGVLSHLALSAALDDFARYFSSESDAGDAAKKFGLTSR